MGGGVGRAVGVAVSTDGAVIVTGSGFEGDAGAVNDGGDDGSIAGGGVFGASMRRVGSGEGVALSRMLGAGIGGGGGVLAEVGLPAAGAANLSLIHI